MNGFQVLNNVYNHGISRISDVLKAFEMIKLSSEIASSSKNNDGCVFIFYKSVGMGRRTANIVPELRTANQNDACELTTLDVNMAHQIASKISSKIITGHESCSYDYDLGTRIDNITRFSLSIKKLSM